MKFIAVVHNLTNIGEIVNDSNCLEKYDGLSWLPKLIQVDRP